MTNLVHAQPTAIRRDKQLLLLLSLLLLLGGMFSPLMEFTRFWFFSEKVSLWGALQTLVKHGEWFLVGVIAGFSVLMPLLKNSLGIVCLQWPHKMPNLHRFLAGLGRWAMLDVFVVALTVVVIKLTALADVELYYGIYLLFASAVLGVVGSSRV